MPANTQTIDSHDPLDRRSATAAAAGTSAVLALGYASGQGGPEALDITLRRQTAAIDRFCAGRGWTLVEIVREVRPAARRSLGNPSLDYALDRLRGGEAGCLVVTELSQLSPSVAQLSGVLDALDEAGARLVALDPPIDTGTLYGRAALGVVRSMSRWERGRRAAMTSAARAKVTTLSVIDPELKRRIRRMRAVGLTLQAIADVLNEERVPTTRGGAVWRPSSVQAALGYRRPRA
jgi:DNA invertase Pin-like site-specific DNA recombinase